MRSPSDELKDLDELSLKRSLKWVDSESYASSRHIDINGRKVINFASNDYLGLSQHPLLKQAMIEGVQRWGVGSSASRLITGSSTAHQALENFIAERKHCQAALTFSTGYATAVGTVSALVGKGDTIILDKLAHASLIDGARLSGATIRVFPHNGLEKLDRLLDSSVRSSGRTLVIIESVYSMDGDIAELEKIIELKNKYGALLLVDEAHGLGIYGDQGLGLSEHLHCSEQIDIHMGTLSKSAGVAGGYIAASQDIIDLIVNKARSFIYSTAPSAAQAHTALASLQLITSDEGGELREKLWANISYLTENLECDAKSAIIPWHIGSSEDALTVSNRLMEEGLYAPAIRFPTVPKNTARLRITLTADHQRSEIDQLLEKLKSL